VGKLPVPRKVPLLSLLAARYPDAGRAQRHAWVLCGEILVDGERVRDPKVLVSPAAQVRRERPRRFVSRGGLKLEGVLERWGIDVAGLGFIDAGAATGGFTDCLLQRGALRVCAVDTGYNRLDQRLRRDARVVVLERTNVMSLRRETLPFVPEAAVADLSLRSLRGAAAHILGLLRDRWLIALVKPQYEAREKASDRAGVVRGRETLYAILADLLGDLRREGVFVARIGPSPLPGRAGNRELFFYLTSDREQELPESERELRLFAGVSAGGLSAE
jgi:23S rRNA (cytidine1920-2'-O)/16S rRNA (cytidine1409-2'-O)-methyltransferase